MMLPDPGSSAEQPRLRHRTTWKRSACSCARSQMYAQAGQLYCVVRPVLVLRASPATRADQRELTSQTIELSVYDSWPRFRRG